MPNADLAHIEYLKREIERFFADLIAETKSHAETAGFLQERKDQLARIREILSMLGDGEPVELAKRAAKVIGWFALRGLQSDYNVKIPTLMVKNRIAIALEAVKEESDMTNPVPRWIVRSARDGDGYDVVRGEEVHWFRREEDAQVAATTFNAWAKDATDE